MFPLPLVCAKALATGQKKKGKKGKKAKTPGTTPSPKPKMRNSLASAIKKRQQTTADAEEPVRKKLESAMSASCSSNPDQRVEPEHVEGETANPAQHEDEVAPSDSNTPDQRSAKPHEKEEGASGSSNPAQDVANLLEGERAGGSALAVEVEGEAAASEQGVASQAKGKKQKDRPHFCGRYPSSHGVRCIC